MERNVYLYVEYYGGVLSETSAELLALAQRLFGRETLTALIGRARAEDIAALPVARAYCGGADYPLFPDQVARAAAVLPLPDLLLAPMSADGRAFASAYAAITRLPLVDNVVELSPYPQRLRVKRGAAANLALTRAELPYPYILLLQPGLWGDGVLPQEEHMPHIEALPLPEFLPPARLELMYVASRQEMELPEAAIVISGGAGMQTPEQFQRLHELGDLLNAPLGGSRVAEDKGWIEHRQMIGATGQTITPRLYLCFGVSGATQHSIGIRGSSHIVAVNTDATAAIFSEADLAVKGDGLAIAEALTALLTAYKPAEEGIAP